MIFLSVAYLMVGIQETFLLWGHMYPCYLRKRTFVTHEFEFLTQALLYIAFLTKQELQ